MAVYVVADSSRVACKIGFTNETDVRVRIANLQGANPFKLELICVGNLLNRDDEQKFHYFLQECRTNGGSEWFFFDHVKTKTVVEFIKHTTKPLPDSWLWELPYRETYSTKIDVRYQSVMQGRINFSMIHEVAIKDKPNRVTETIMKKRRFLNDRLSAGLVTQKRLDEINQTLNFERHDYLCLQELSSEAQYYGWLLQEEKMTIFNLLGWRHDKKDALNYLMKDEWDVILSKLNSQPLEVKVVLTQILAELEGYRQLGLFKNSARKRHGYCDWSTTQRFLNSRLAQSKTLDFDFFIQSSSTIQTDIDDSDFNY